MDVRFAHTGVMSMRSDAVRNREALIAAARQVFEAEGIDAPLENVAAAAGLSRTSLHRAFASRSELLAAIWASDVAETEADAARFAGRPDAFVAIFDATLAQQVDRRSIHPSTAQIESADIVALAARFVAAIESTVEISRAAGVLRDDVSNDAGLRPSGWGSGPSGTSPSAPSGRRSPARCGRCSFGACSIRTGRHRIRRSSRRSAIGRQGP